MSKLLSTIVISLLFVGNVALATNPLAITRPLGPGATGEDVAALQSWLITQGYGIPLGVTGYYGAQTMTAVSAWQKANKIATLGYYGYFGARSMLFIKEHPVAKPKTKKKHPTSTTSSAPERETKTEVWCEVAHTRNATWGHVRTVWKVGKARSNEQYDEVRECSEVKYYTDGGGFVYQNPI